MDNNQPNQNNNKNNNNQNKKRRPKPVSAYHELNNLLIEVKNGNININEAMNLVQLREPGKTIRPYCKLLDNGNIALYGIKREAIELDKEQWERLTTTIESGYIKKYIQYNEERINEKKRDNKSNQDQE